MSKERRPFPDADPTLSYDLAKFELSAQLSSFDSLNHALAGGISLATAVVAILLAAFGIRFGQESADISRLAFGFLAGGGGLYVLSLGFLAFAVRGADFSTGLGAQNAWDEAEKYRDHEEVLYWWAVETLIESLRLNRIEYASKKFRANVGFGLLGLELLIAAAAVVMTIA